MNFSDIFLNKVGSLSGLCFFVVLVTVLLCAMPVQAQSTRDLNNRIKRLENDLETLNRAVYRGEKPNARAPAPSFSGGVANPAVAEVRIQELETELRDLTGQIEEQNFKIRQLETQFERLSSDVNLRLQDLESGARDQPRPGAITSQDTGGNNYQWNSGNAPNNPVEINPDLVTPNDPAALYNRAFSLLKQEKYANSQVLFQNFLDQNPDHKLAGNAIYWLGETHYVRGEYDRSAQIFAEAYQKYPKSPKAPDNVLKLGMSLAGAGKKEEACIALKQVNLDHADSSAVTRRAAQEMTKLGC